MRSSWARRRSTRSSSKGRFEAATAQSHRSPARSWTTHFPCGVAAVRRVRGCRAVAGGADPVGGAPPPSDRDARRSVAGGRRAEPRHHGARGVRGGAPAARRGTSNLDACIRGHGARCRGAARVPGVPAPSGRRAGSRSHRPDFDDWKHRSCAASDPGPESAAAADASRGRRLSIDGLSLKRLTGKGIDLAWGELGAGSPVVVVPAWVSNLEVIAEGSDPRSALIEHLAVITVRSPTTGAAPVCRGGGSRLRRRSRGRRARGRAGTSR